MATQETMKMVKERKQQAAELIRFANPKSRIRPSVERVIQVVSGKIPYKTSIPCVTSVTATYYSKNSLIETARLRVETAFHGAWEVTAYKNLVGRSEQERQADSVADFPSGLFKVFADKIKGE